MKPPIFVAALTLLSISTVFSGEVLFLNHNVSVPAGWTVVPRVFECMGSPVKETLVLRNEDGAIWVIAQMVPEPTFSKAEDGMKKEYIFMESGEVAQSPFSIFSIPPNSCNPRSRVIEFPKIQTCFSFMFTKKGSMDCHEARKSWTPPPEAEYESYFKCAKDAVFALVTNMSRDSSRVK